MASDARGARGSARGALTPRPFWSDGIHTVRHASVKDQHPMRFVCGARRVTASKFSRHAPNEDTAIALARLATERWLKDHPEDSRHWTGVADGSREAPEPQASASQQSKPKIELQPFSLTHFECVAANPVAQVWLCTTRTGEKKAAGRRKKGGREASETPIYHDIGQAAVLLHKEPVRDPDGRVTIFRNWYEAQERAIDLYQQADEEDRFYWPEGHQRIHSTRRIDVIFDPEVNGTARPFSLYIPEFRRPIYEDRTRIIPGMQLQKSKINAMVNPQAKLLEKEARAKHRSMHREASLEERPLRFKTIYNAIEEAERRERRWNGEDV